MRLVIKQIKLVFRHKLKESKRLKFANSFMVSLEMKGLFFFFQQIDQFLIIIKKDGSGFF